MHNTVHILHAILYKIETKHTRISRNPLNRVSLRYSNCIIQRRTDSSSSAKSDFSKMFHILDPPLTKLNAYQWIIDKGLFRSISYRTNYVHNYRFSGIAFWQSFEVFWASVNRRPCRDYVRLNQIRFIYFLSAITTIFLSWYCKYLIANDRCLMSWWVAIIDDIKWYKKVTRSPIKIR